MASVEVEATTPGIFQDPSPCSVPNGLQELLEQFTAQIIQKKPKDIYGCLAEYCAAELNSTKWFADSTSLTNREQLGDANHVGMSDCIPQRMPLIEDQRLLLENLRSELCKSVEPRQTSSKCDDVHSHDSHAPAACVKSKINSVLTQAVELVKTLEQMQNSAAGCQENLEASTQSVAQSTETRPPSDSKVKAKGGHEEPQPAPINQQQICDQIHCLVKYMDQLSQQFDTLVGNPQCPYHEDSRQRNE